MDKKTAGLLGAIAGLATMGAAHAATAPAANGSEGLQAASYADLLAPVENAVALMKADDGARVQASQPGDVQRADYYERGGYDSDRPVYHHHHHHHHHHHAYYRNDDRYRRDSSAARIPGVGGVRLGDR